jgi:MFS family permease
MVMIANLQYGWTLFTIPLKDKFGWSLASIQVAFTLFVLFETWLVPAEGYLVDRFGPKIVVLVGGALAGLAWIMNSYATSLTMLYTAQIIGGIGAGAVYGTCIGNALKWFPDRRGLAAGLTAAGFGIGSAFTIIPIQSMIRTHGLFAWGEIFSLFPTTCTDCFGVEYATANAGLLYTAKGTASLLVPLTNLLVIASGGWKSAFIIASLFNLIAAAMALVVLKPIRQRMLERSTAPATTTARVAG